MLLSKHLGGSFIKNWIRFVPLEFLASREQTGLSTVWFPVGETLWRQLYYKQVIFVVKLRLRTIHERLNSIRHIDILCKIALGYKS